MKEMISVSSRRLEGPRRCTTQPPQMAGASEPFKSGYLELAPEVMERLLSTDNIEDHYEVESLPFARGKYATVRRCRHRKTGVQYAAKYLKKRRRSTDLRYEILHEVAVLHACAQCPRIVNLIQVFETTNEMILVLELASGGELQTLLDNDEIPEEQTVKRFMRQILDGLEFLHSVNVAHLDIKPQNLVLTSEFPGCDVKLCDFGISRYIGQSADIREILGTPDYVAPEVLNYEVISLATDMWSVGVLLYVLLTGCSPFGGDTKQETFCNISQCRLDFPDDLFEEISEDAKDLMRRLMVKDSSSRLTATECLQHSWFQTTELPVSVPPVPTADDLDGSVSSNISEVLIRTPESTRKLLDSAPVKRQSSIRKTPEFTRKTIECVRRTPETAHKLMIHGPFPVRTPEVSRRSFPTPDPVRKLTEINSLSRANIQKNWKGSEKTRKHSFNESVDDLISIKEKTRKLSEERPFENRRQTSMRDLSRRSSVELLANGIVKKRQTSFRETVKKNNETKNSSSSTTTATNTTTTTTEETLSVPKNSSGSSEATKAAATTTTSPNDKIIKKKFDSDLEAGKENELVTKDDGDDGGRGHEGGEEYDEEEAPTKGQNVNRNLKFFLKNDESPPRIYIENTMKKALSSQTLPIHPIFHRNIDKAIYKCKRIYIDDELGSNAAILIPVNSGQSSMSSISGTSSETSSITSDTLSEMSVDSSGDCSSFISSDDSLDYVYKSVWDSGLKTGKVWIKECRGSFERALSRFNLDRSSSSSGGEQDSSPTSGTGSPSRRYQKNAGSGSLNRKSIYMSSPILNKIGNLGAVGTTDSRKYGVQLMKEGNGNVVVIREVKAGRYTKFSEVKCESVQSRIKKLQDQKG